MNLKSLDRKLALVGSERRAPLLVDILQTTESKVSKRQLLRDWFSSCDALAPWRHDLAEQFDIAGYVTDAKKSEQPALPVTVYRGAWEDDDVETALSWTTDLERAEWFARYLTSVRAMFLGIHRTDVSPVVFQGTCTEAYGYLTGRGEHEVVAKTVEDIEAISMLVAQKEVA
jgi:hypothetical protein